MLSARALVDDLSGALFSGRLACTQRTTDSPKKRGLAMMDREITLCLFVETTRINQADSTGSTSVMTLSTAGQGKSHISSSIRKQEVDENLAT